MIEIDNKLISSELFRVKFVCHPEQCLGSCCVYGDSGAPLDKDEAELLEREFERIMHRLSPEGANSIKRQGAWIFDEDGDRVTPLIDGHECAYAVFEEGQARCSIENAFHKGEINFQKPRSCHLYPIRVTKVGEYYALNYHKWHICDPALKKGKEENIPVFRFLRKAIIRVWGESFYEELENVYSQLLAENSLWKD